jgi:hypothetical protein
MFLRNLLLTYRFDLFFLVVWFWTLKRLCFSELSVNFYRTSLRHVSEDSNALLHALFAMCSRMKVERWDIRVTETWKALFPAPTVPNRAIPEKKASHSLPITFIRRFRYEWHLWRSHFQIYPRPLTNIADSVRAPLYDTEMWVLLQKQAKR